MKKSTRLLLLLPLSLASCVVPGEEPPSWKDDAFGMTVFFMTSFEDDKEEVYHCYIADSYRVSYQDSNGKGVELKLEDWGIDGDTLIPGDALIFENNAEDIRFLTTSPMQLIILGEVRSIKVAPCSIYEVTLIKDGDQFSFVHQGDADVEIALPQLKDDYALTKTNETIERKSFSSYEEGTTFYYAYNEALEKPLNYTCIFDYRPR